MKEKADPHSVVAAVPAANPFHPRSPRLAARTLISAFQFSSFQLSAFQGLPSIFNLQPSSIRPRAKNAGSLARTDQAKVRLVLGLGGMQTTSVQATSTTSPSAARRLTAGIQTHPEPIDEFPILRKWEAYFVYGLKDVCQKPISSFAHPQ